MLNWEQLDPKRTERGIQILLHRLYGVDIRSFDGAGGDGGRDALLVTPDGRTVFEIKSFGRLTNKRRRQVEQSLRKAVESEPDMTRWELIIPMNMTPRRPGVKSSEQAWFDTRLQAIAPGVALVWRGQDWLDSQIAGKMDLQRYIEGRDAQLLQRLSDLNMETAVLAGGATDLRARVENLRRVVDEVSPFWTLDFGLRDGVHVSTLRAKTPDAPILDPIRMTPTFTFREADDDLRAQLERTLDFGGRVDLPAGYVTSIEIEASEEARLLLGSHDPTSSGYTLMTERVALDRPIRCSYQVLSADEQVLSEFPVFMRERTSGARGATVFGSDAAGIATFEVDLPRRDELPSSGEPVTLEHARFKLDLPPSVVGYDVTSLLPLYETFAAAQAGTFLRFQLPGLGWLGTHGPIEEPPVPGAGEIRQVVADLHRMEQLIGTVLRFPDNLTHGEALDLRRAVRRLEGETVEFDGRFTLNLRPEGLTPFLATLGDHPDHDGGLCAATSDLALEVGSLTLPYGPSAFWAPHARLVNRAELEAIAAGTDTAGEEIHAHFEPTDLAFRWLSREQAEAYIEGGLFDEERGAVENDAE